jgi:hypothetical protein
MTFDKGSATFGDDEEDGAVDEDKNVEGVDNTSDFVPSTGISGAVLVNKADAKDANEKRGGGGLGNVVETDEDCEDDNNDEDDENDVDDEDEDDEVVGSEKEDMTKEVSEVDVSLLMNDKSKFRFLRDVDADDDDDNMVDSAEDDSEVNFDCSI